MPPKPKLLDITISSPAPSIRSVTILKPAAFSSRFSMLIDGEIKSFVTAGDIHSSDNKTEIWIKGKFFPNILQKEYEVKIILLDSKLCSKSAHWIRQDTPLQTRQNN